MEDSGIADFTELRAWAGSQTRKQIAWSWYNIKCRDRGKLLVLGWRERHVIQWRAVEGRRPESGVFQSRPGLPL